MNTSAVNWRIGSLDWVIPSIGGNSSAGSLDYLADTGNLSSSFPSPEPENAFQQLNFAYVFCEVLVAVTAVLGNALTILVFVLDRKLRRLTNYYIVSLAMADLLVGIPGIPFAILTSIGIPKNPYMCLPMLSLLLVLCTVSIFCLVAVSVDRYWAILYPLRYSRVMTAKIARRIIMLCWVAGTCLGVIPMMGWRMEYEGDCVFTRVMDYDFLVFIYFSTIVGPGLLMAFFYTHIYTVVLKQTKLSVKSEHGTLRQIAAQEPQSEGGSLSGGSQRQKPHFLTNRNQGRWTAEVNRCDSRRQSTSTNIVHQVTHPSRREVKAAKSLSIIVLFFLICWFPLYTINCVQAFCTNCVVPGEVMFFTIILTHVNSAVNPFLYAYHMKDFRHALKTFILQRILRRGAQSDPLYGRSLVSPHHSTLYRINAPGSGSPQLANFHTPHAHNTPITSSPSPIAGTPGGIRSRSSTLGSYGPWLPSTGVSPNPSLMRTPESQDDTMSRPRAATINTHSAPAFAHKAKEEEGSLMKPLLSASHLIVSADDSQSSFTAKEESSLHAGTLSFGPNTTDPKDVIFSVNNDGNDTAGPASGHQVMSISSGMISSKSEILLTDNSAAAATAAAAAAESSDESCGGPSIDPIMQSSMKSTYNYNDSSNYGANSNIAKVHGNLKNNSSDLEKSDTHSISESQELLNSDEHCSSADLEKHNCEISMPVIDDHGSAEIESDSLVKMQYAIPEENNRNGTDPSVKATNGKKLDASATFTASHIPNGTDDINSGSADDSETPLNCGSFDSNKKRTESLGVEASDEASRLTQEFYKFLPKILRKKEENKKSKSPKTGKGWFSNIIRHRSYHGITLDVTASKQLPRAQSISGAMET